MINKTQSYVCKVVRSLCFSILLLEACVNVLAVNNARLTLLKVDSMPKVKAMVNLQVVGKRLCMVYEMPNRWGAQLVRTFSVDESQGTLKYEYEYFRNPAKSNGIDYPVIFQDRLDNTYVIDRTYPLVYSVDMDKHTMQNTHHFVFSNKAKVPYAMALNVQFAYRLSDSAFAFVGRQPKMGAQAVFKSFLDSASVRVEEVAPIVYTKKYPAWTTNFGRQTFDRRTDVLVHGFYLYPAVQYVNLKTKQSRVIKIAEPNWKRLKPLSPDVWGENLMQIKDVTSTDTNVYALWWNKSQSSMEVLRKQGKASCKIVVLDWDGNIKTMYTVNKSLTNIVACADGKLIGSDGKNFWLITLM